jgi:hypothetical protein
MPFRLVTSPRSIEAAYRTLTDPAAHHCHPAIIQTNWKFLKEGRGERFYPERLSITCHMIEQAAPAVAPAAPTVNEVDAARVASIPLIKRAMRTLGLEPRGAA